MSDFFTKLKRVFVVDTPETSTAPAPSAAKTPTTVAERPATAQPNSAETAGKPQDKFTELLLRAVENSNQEGFDYIEYKRAVQALETMPMDEKTRYFSAFAAAQAMGVTKDKLLSSADFYLSVLRNEQLKFQEASTAQRQRQIGAREEEIASLEKTIQQKGEQIARLTEEIQQHQAKVQAMKAEISESVSKIETTQTDFEASHAYIANQIQTDRERITQYL